LFLLLHVMAMAMRRPPLHREFSDDNDNDNDICFQLVDVTYKLCGTNWRGRRCVIYLFGVTKEGNSVTVVVRNFKPYFYLRSVQPSLEKPLARKVQEDLNSYLRGCNHLARGGAGNAHVESVEFVNGMHSLWGYDGGAGTAVWRITMSSTMHVAPLRNGLSRGEVRSSLGPQHRGYDKQTYESDFPFVLRYMVDRGISACGWVRVAAGSYVDCIDCVDYCNTQICVEVVESVKDDLSVTSMDGGGTAPLVMLSFDIECAGREGFFPEPELDPVIQIACYATVHGRKIDPSYGTSAPISYVLFQWKTCGAVHSDPPGATVTCYDTEEDLLVGFGDYVRDLDPDLITGWNIMSFDLPYLLQRADAIGLEKFSFYEKLSRCDRLPSLVASTSHSPFKKTKKKAAAATGDEGDESKEKQAVIPGRVVFDGLPLVRANFKLRSYTLDAVSRHFLGDDVGKDEVNHKEITGLFEGTDDDRARLGHYCLRDAWLPSRLISKLLLDVRSIEMARVTALLLNYLMTRGQSAKVLMEIYRASKRLGFLVPHVERHAKEEKYPGAVVLDPKCGYYPEPIVVLDFASLYPSIMQAHNLCYSTMLVGGKQEALALKLDPDVDCEVTYTGDWFVRKHVRKGILPLILERLLEARKSAKRDMAAETDPHLVSVHDGRQLALKIVANSGARTTKSKSVYSYQQLF